ncbi:MAG: PilZ domain-containing protein [Candidatus Omnitrophica bacterium]|nr:PilZ domain-containing protein [Candidatus Omnitrophota bacterium]MCM8823245.1 PilZ domain-containing protein [Candidatus Omnitrophota bacterium]MCM8827187.1 PilZ domain-containing protein [Candidatus Omnitrophota bacterium]
MIGKLDIKELANTKNISGGGVCITVNEKIEKGTILFLKINLPEKDNSIEAKGKVMWCAEFISSALKEPRYDLGIEFVDIKEVDRQKVFQYVFGHLRKER